MEDAIRLFEENGALIRAAKDKSGAEPWNAEYKKDPESFAKLLKAEAKLERVMRQYFAGLAERAPSFINWSKYMQVKNRIHASSDEDLEIDVIVNEQPFEEEVAQIMYVIYDPIELAVRMGAEAGENIYFYDLQEDAFNDVVSKTARKNTAFLVGKRIDKDGNIIDNPKAKYRITDVDRQKIRNAIKTSLALGEDQKAATARIRETINDPKRAARIAQTEAVNGYQGGLYGMASTSGATKKEWQALVGACTRCMTNAAAGEIGIDEDFPSGHQFPSCHTGDRCGLRYIWPEL